MKRYASGLPAAIPSFGIVVDERPAKPGEKLGSWRAPKIFINSKQARVGKHATFIHELLHATDQMLVQTKTRKRLISHDFITNAAPNILMLLVDAGLYRGISRRSLRAWHRATYRKDGTARKKRGGKPSGEGS